MGSDKMASRRGARLQVLLGAAAMGVFLTGTGAGANELIGVNLDQAKLVKLPEGTSTIVVGNPAIADISIQRNGVVVITGRRAGRTNFIALDKAGSIISESTVAVSVATAGRVLMRRGMDVVTYDCSTECLPAAGFGDESQSFGRIMSQANERTKEVREAVGSSLK